MATMCCAPAVTADQPNVILNLYDLIPDANKALRLLGTGAFHAAVEVYGQEWSYGFTETGSGIFNCPPKNCIGATFRESIPMGSTLMTQQDVNSLLDKMRSAWRGMEYDLLRKNCCSFSNAFCQELGVGAIPRWVTNLAAAGATVGDGIIKAASVTHSAAIIAAAKAGEINEKYKITGTAQAKAQDFVAAMRNLESEYQLRQKAEGMANKVATQAGELDRQYGITQRAQAVAARAGEIDKQGQLQGAVNTAATQVSSVVQNLARQSLAASQAAAQGISQPPPRQGGQASNAAGGKSDGCVCF